MKKLTYTLVALVLILSVFVLPCFAEDELIPDGTTVIEPETPSIDGEATDETPENTPESPENSVVAPERDFVGEVIAVVTNGEIWAEFGVLAGGVIAVIIAITTNVSKIADAFETIKQMLSGKATKEETEESVSAAVNGVKEVFVREYETLEGKYNSLEDKYNTQTAVLTLLALQLVKSPNARVQIMALLEKGENIGNNVSEVVEAIQEEIKQADATEPKPDTPALDIIAAEVKEEPVMILR